MKKKQLLTGNSLKEKATALGINLVEVVPAASKVSVRSAEGIDVTEEHIHKTEVDLRQEIYEHKRSIRESRLWIVAVVSAAASVVSAITALIAVLSS